MPTPSKLAHLGRDLATLVDDGRNLFGTADNPLHVTGASATATAGSVPQPYVKVSPLTTATPLPAAPDGMTFATVIPEGAPVRVRKDGTNPTADLGMPLAIGQPMRLYGDELAAARFIEQSAGAKLNVEFGK